jgi:phosphonate transport system substrate-binding protein
MIRKLLACLAGSILLATNPAVAQGMKEIKFGIISTESTQNLKSDWQPILDDLAKKTGMKVNAFFAPDYAGIIEGMRFNKVHVAWYGNKSAMEAVDRANGEVFGKRPANPSIQWQ